MKKKVILSSMAAIVLLTAGVALFYSLASTEPEVSEGENTEQTTTETSEADEAESTEDTEESEAIPVEVTKALQQDVSRKIYTTTTLEAEKEVEIVARIEGTVTKLVVEEGDWVNDGTILVELDGDEKRLQLQQAQYEYQYREKLSRRATALVEKGVLSQEQLDKLELERDIAKSELDLAQFNLTQATIRAPFEGIIVERLIEFGQTVKPTDSLLRLADLHPLRARIYPPEIEALHLKTGQQTTLVLDSQKTVSFHGVVSMISPVVDRDTGTVKVTIDVVNPPAVVKAGSFVRVSLAVETHLDAILAPKQSLLQDELTPSLFVVKEGKAKKVPVSLGFEHDGWVEIQEGIQVEDVVVVVGKETLHDGSAVEIINASNGSAPN